MLIHGRYNLPGLALGAILLAALLVITPLVIKQNRFLLTTNLMMEDLQEIRLNIRRAFLGEPRPEAPVEVTTQAGLFPKTWTKKNAPSTLYGGPVSVVKTAESGAKIVKLSLLDLKPKQCAALLWRLTQKQERQAWLGIYSGEKPMGLNLSPAESATACQNSHTITLTFKY